MSALVAAAVADTLAASRAVTSLTRMRRACTLMDAPAGATTLRKARSQTALECHDNDPGSLEAGLATRCLLV